MICVFVLRSKTVVLCMSSKSATKTWGLWADKIQSWNGEAISQEKMCLQGWLKSWSDWAAMLTSSDCWDSIHFWPVAKITCPTCGAAQNTCGLCIFRSDTEPETGLLLHYQLQQRFEMQSACAWIWKIYAAPRNPSRLSRNLSALMIKFLDH